MDAGRCGRITKSLHLDREEGSQSAQRIWIKPTCMQHCSQISQFNVAVSFTPLIRDPTSDLQAFPVIAPLRTMALHLCACVNPQ